MSERNLISMGDISRARWDELYTRCCYMISHPGDLADSCRGKIMASLFFEPSTRTSFSFQAAMLRLGGTIFGFSDPNGTSVSKGETLSDTIRVAGSYSDTIIIRSPYEGAAKAAALYSEVPIINAGDGGHFHPTQTLTDLATIAQKRGKIGNFRIGLCGDLKYGRTVNSLTEALLMFPGITFYFISPKELRAPEYVRELLRKNGREYIESDDLSACMPELDILYMTRIQRERFPSLEEYERLRGVYVLTKKLLERARPDMLILHPLPRHGEIEQDVDSDPRAAYFDQVRYGMYIRMALLLDFLHLPRLAPPPVIGENAAGKCQNPVCITRAEPYLPLLTPKDDPSRCGYCDKMI